MNGSTSGSSSSQPTSYVATSSSNAAQVGQTNSAGLLVYQPATTALDAVDFQNFFSAAYANASVKGIALRSGSYTVNTQLMQAALTIMAWTSFQNHAASAVFKLLLHCSV